jgi:hypothetical protein
VFLGFEMPSWFDLLTLDASGPEDEAGIKKVGSHPFPRIMHCPHDGIRDVYRVSQILPGSSNGTKRRGGGKNLLSYLFLCLKFYKIENCFIFEYVEKKFEPIHLLKKSSLSSQKYGSGF